PAVEGMDGAVNLPRLDRGHSAGGQLRSGAPGGTVGSAHRAGLYRIPVLPVSDRPDVCPGSQFDLGPDHVAGADESVPLVVGVADLLYFKRPARRRTGGGLSVLGQLVAGPAATAIGTACRGCRADLLSPSGPPCLADDDEIPMNLEDPLINLDAYCDRI